MEKRTVDALSVCLPPPSFPAIDRAFALLSRRLRLPFTPMTSAVTSERQQRRQPTEPAAPEADSELTPAACIATSPPLLHLTRPPSHSHAPLLLPADSAMVQLPKRRLDEGKQQREEQKESSGVAPAAAVEAAEEERAEAEQKEQSGDNKWEEAEAQCDIAMLHSAWLQWRRGSGEQRRLAVLRQAAAERQHRRRLQQTAWAEWEAAMAVRISVCLSLSALADGWRRRHLLLLVCSGWSSRCRHRRAVRSRCRQRLRQLGQRDLGSGFPAAQVRQDDGTSAMAEGWHRHRLVAQAWRGWLHCMVSRGQAAMLSCTGA